MAGRPDVPAAEATSASAAANTKPVAIPESAATPESASGSRPVATLKPAAASKPAANPKPAAAPQPLVAADASLEEIRAAFSADRFATGALGARLEEAQAGFARVSMEIGPEHLNGMGSLMGGVSFTLADFAFAVASNVGQAPTVSVSNTIDYLGTPRDQALTATCEVEKSGRTLCFARVSVADGAGNPVARVNITGLRKG